MRTLLHMVCARGVTALLVACLLWCGCTERTLAVNPPHGFDAGGPGGAGGAGGDSVQKMGDPCPAPTRANSCSGFVDCWKTCGPSRSGFRNCSCDASGTLKCIAACLYEPGQDAAALRCLIPFLPVPPIPRTRPRSCRRRRPPCQLDPCRPCGSSTEVGYLDSGGAPHVGYCICVPNPDTGRSVYSCAKVTEWPSQQASLPAQ